jgi:molybdenum cofactor synthesis domain-containing protein
MIRFGILIISDRSSKGIREDLTGPALQAYLVEKGHSASLIRIIPDETDQIAQVLSQWADEHLADVVLTSGGTGFSPRDVTPEATFSIIEKPAPGISEAIRMNSLKVTPHAMLSRAVSGIRKQTLIINLPGSPRGACESLEFILPVLPHAVELMQDSATAELGHNKSG